MSSLGDYANEFFTPEILSLVFLLGYMSTQFFDGLMGNLVSSIKRKNRRQIKKLRHGPTVPELTRSPPPPRDFVPELPRSAPTKEVTTSTSSSRIFRIIVMLLTIQLLPQLFTELGLSDEILEIFSYGILNNVNSYSWLQWSLILSAGYLCVESTFETENFHLFSIPIVFLSAMVIQGTFPKPLFFVYCFLFMSILQALKVRNTNLTVFGLSSNIRDYFGQKKYPANIFAASLIQGRQRQLTDAWKHVDADGNFSLALADSRWSSLNDPRGDRVVGIFYWLLVVAVVIIDASFLGNTLDNSTIRTLIYVTLVCLSLTYHGIIFATWVWYLISYNGFTGIYSEIPGTLIALALIYIIFYSTRHYFNNRKIMNITNLIILNPSYPDELTLKEELRSHGWTGKIYIWIKLGIFGLLNNLIVSFICVIQLFVGLLILIINAVYLFITGWLRSFGFSEVAVGERFEIDIVNLKYLLTGLSTVIISVAESIIHGILAPWASSYWLFAPPEGKPTSPPEDTTNPRLIWYMFRNSESAKFPLFYYIAAVISWYHSVWYIVIISLILLFLAFLILAGQGGS